MSAARSPTCVLVKTDQGRARLSGRCDLPLIQRRILILVDGQKNAAELECFAHTANLNDVLFNLQRHGLVAPKDCRGCAAVTCKPHPVQTDAGQGSGGPPQEVSEHFAEVRQRALDFVTKRVGQVGQSMAIPTLNAINNCFSLTDLRQILKDFHLRAGKIQSLN